MRFFIFPLENIYVAISADKVKSFVSMENNIDTGHIKIPVCMIFGKREYGQNVSCHGIILKQDDGASGILSGDKSYLIITPPVEKDIHIEEKEIQNLPGNFGGIYYLFNGLYFNNQKLILFLDIEKFISHWQGIK